MYVKILIVHSGEAGAYGRSANSVIKEEAKELLMSKFDTVRENVFLRCGIVPNKCTLFTYN